MVKEIFSFLEAFISKRTNFENVALWESQGIVLYVVVEGVMGG